MVETRVLLTTTTKWPNASRLMIELLRAGHAASILCSHDHPSAEIRSAPARFLYSRFRPLDSLAKAIAAAAPDLVIPCDDLSVLHLHQLYASYGAHSARQVDIPALIIRSLGHPESYPIVASRRLLLDIAHEEGILAPETRAISNLEELSGLLAQLPSPWVLKADGSNGGCGVRIAATLAQAEASFTELRRPVGPLRFIKRLMVNRDVFLPERWRDSVWNAGPEVIAQRFIQGRPANCAVVCRDGEVLAGIGCEVISDQLSLGPASAVQLVDNPAMMAAAAKIARRLRLSGFFGLDFILEEGSGSAFLIELNPRCTQHCHLRLGEGRDMIGALSAAFKGTQLRRQEPVTQNSQIAYFPRALLMGSDFLLSCYHDAPLDEPELLQALLLVELKNLRKEKERRRRQPPKTADANPLAYSPRSIAHSSATPHIAEPAPKVIDA